MVTFLFHERCGRRDQLCFFLGWGDQKAVPWAEQRGFLNVQVRMLELYPEGSAKKGEKAGLVLCLLVGGTSQR